MKKYRFLAIAAAATVFGMILIACGGNGFGPGVEFTPTIRYTPPPVPVNPGKPSETEIKRAVQALPALGGAVATEPEAADLAESIFEEVGIVLQTSGTAVAEAASDVNGAVEEVVKAIQGAVDNFMEEAEAAPSRSASILARIVLAVKSNNLSYTHSENGVSVTIKGKYSTDGDDFTGENISVKGSINAVSGGIKITGSLDGNVPNIKVVSDDVISGKGNITVKAAINGSSGGLRIDGSLAGSVALDVNSASSSYSGSGNIAVKASISGATSNGSSAGYKIAGSLDETIAVNINGLSNITGNGSIAAKASISGNAGGYAVSGDLDVSLNGNAAASDSLKSYAGNVNITVNATINGTGSSGGPTVVGSFNGKLNGNIRSISGSLNPEGNIAGGIGAYVAVSDGSHFVKLAVQSDITTGNPANITSGSYRYSGYDNDNRLIFSSEKSYSDVVEEDEIDFLIRESLKTSVFRSAY
ncbi:hypothetical protein FACS1894151_01740 [Spirochaetia bacterium]|nr:hypothetical protein FACS1894151_01740 [Spirochaetia bacterium]